MPVETAGGGGPPRAVRWSKRRSEGEHGGYDAAAAGSPGTRSGGIEMLAGRLRARRALVAVALTTGLAVAPAEAAEARPKPPPVTGLTATVTGVGSSYDVTATWDAATAATSYRASLEARGTVLAKATVAQP